MNFCNLPAGLVTQQMVIEGILELFSQLNGFESFSALTGKYFRHSLNQFPVSYFLQKHNIDINTCENDCVD